MMKRILHTLSQTGAGIICGSFAVLFLAQYDPWIHAYATRIFIRELERGLHCQVSGKVRLVNLVKPELLLDDVRVCSYDVRERDAWGWHAKHYATSFSWWHFLTSGIIDMAIAIDGFELHTQMTEDGSAAIEPHLRQLVAGPDLDVPLYLKSLHLHNAFLTARSPHDALLVRCAWNSESKKIHDRFRSTISVMDGSFTKDQQCHLSALSGSIMAEASGTDQAMRLNVSCDCRGQWAAVPDQLCFLTGTWEHDHGLFTAYSMDRSFILSPCALTYRNADVSLDATLHIPLAVLSRTLGFAAPPGIEGSCTVCAQGSVMQQQLQGTVTSTLSTHALPEQIFSVASSFTKNVQQVSGHAALNFCDRELVQGDWNWDTQTLLGSLCCENAQDIPITIPGTYSASYGWALHPSDLRCEVHANRDGVTASYRGTAHHDVLAKHVDFSGGGTWTYASGDISMAGLWKDHRYALSANSFQFPFLKNITYTINDHSLLTLSHESGTQFTSSIDISLLRSIVSNVCHYDVQGEGTLRMNFSLNDSRIVCDAQLHEGTIRLPETYNFINGLKTHIECNPQTRTIVMRDLLCLLHSGTVRTKRAVVQYAPDWSIDFVHIPIWLDRCLLNSKKNLFATTSANLLVSKPSAGGYMLMGHVILDRSQLKENIFSDAFQKTLLQATQSISHAPHFDMACNVSLETKDPVRVDTDFLKANAQVHLAIRNTIMDPSLSGVVTILSGTLKFPYKPLQINRGTIQFVPDQPLNPHIELIAKNTIKNHRISLQINGSLRDHMVMMESTPPLTQEQIVGLLLAGAHDESLSAVIPALLMQNITNLVFSNSEKTGLVGVWDRYVKPWIKQFNVNFVPRLSDQTGRGGLRGILEMSVNDRWRALIEKNFSLTEDTRFELEYLLSDDVTFRVIRDERYDIGGEVEMRWKF